MTTKPVQRAPLWPAPLELEGLRAALLPGDRALETWNSNALLRDPPEGRLAEIMPLIFFNLQAAGLPMVEMPDAAHAFTTAAAINEALDDAGRAVLTRLANAGVPSLILKGAALSLTAYPHRAARPMADFDILVPYKQITAAMAALKAARYAPAMPITQTALQTRASAQFFNAAGDNIDLHWHALGGYPSERLDDLFWEGSVAYELGAGTSILRPAEQFCHITAHAFRDGRPPLRRFTDAALIIRSAGAEMDWQRLAEVSESLAMTIPVTETLAYLQAEIGQPVPDPAFEALRHNNTGTTERWRYRLKARLDPGSISAALIRAWESYANARTTDSSFADPVRFIRFLVRYLGSGAQDPDAVSAIRRKLRGG